MRHLAIPFYVDLFTAAGFANFAVETPSIGAMTSR